MRDLNSKFKIRNSKLYCYDFNIVQHYFAFFVVGVCSLEEDAYWGVVIELAPCAPQVDVNLLPLAVGVERHNRLGRGTA